MRSSGALSCYTVGMNDAILDDLAIEKSCKEHFNVNLDIAEVIARGVPVGVAARATVFVTTTKQVYTYINSQSGLVLDDVRKIVSRMQTEAEVFVPRYGEAE